MEAPNWIFLELRAVFKVYGSCGCQAFGSMSHALNALFHRGVNVWSSRVPASYTRPAFQRSSHEQPWTPREVILTLPPYPSANEQCQEWKYHDWQCIEPQRGQKLNQLLSPCPVFALCNLRRQHCARCAGVCVNKSGSHFFQVCVQTRGQPCIIRAAAAFYSMNATNMRLRPVQPKEKRFG